jgi:outer membrane receptor for ferrienterochelin and colicin
MNKSWSEPNTVLLPPISLESCKSCASIQDTAEDYAAKQWRYVGDVLRIETVASTGISGATSEVTVRGIQPASKVIDATGNTRQSVKETRQQYVFLLDFGLGWRVSEIKLVAS